MNTAKLTMFARRLISALKDEEVTDLGFATDFTKRLREVVPYQLSVALITALATQRVETIADLQRAFNALTGKSVRYKPFHNQLSKAAFPRFMKRVFERFVEKLVVAVLEPIAGSALKDFNDIVIQDGTSFAIKASLRKQFPGRFTGVSPAAVEVHTTMSLLSDNPQRVEISPDSQGERDFLPHPVDLRGKLLLGDRGYLSLYYCQDVMREGGSVIVRSKTGINPTVLQGWVGGEEQAKFTGKKLQDLMGRLTNRSADLSVEWTRSGRPIRLRLVALWNATMKEHTFLLTNLQRERFDLQTVGSLYRLRWQVELVFKEYKSYANLHAYDTGKAAIAEGLIWASLAAALLKRFLAHAAQLTFRGFESSTRRVTMALTFHLPILMQALIAGDGVRPTLRRLLEYLRSNGRRAHPSRDRARGRLSLGLAPITASVNHF